MEACLNISINTSYTSNGQFNATMPSAEFSYYKKIPVILDMYVIPVLCVLGVLGNALNVAVLSHRRLYHSVEHLERSSLTGLLALAVSDMLLCSTIFPHAFRDRKPYISNSVDFWLLYDTYNNGVINTWMLLSAGLTVALAVCRYLAVCRPLYARSRSQSMGLIVLIVLIGSILVNLPRFWNDVIKSFPCVNGQRMYFSASGPLKQERYDYLQLTYIWVYFFVGIVAPVITLIYCTTELLRALHQSRRLRRSHSSDNNSGANKNLVTSTLVAVVIFYILLVAPAEFIKFIHFFARRQNFSLDFSMKYHLMVSVCNTLQAVNFSFHFMLYCIVNAHFRRVAMGLWACVIPKRYLTEDSKGPETQTLRGHGTVGTRHSLMSSSDCGPAHTKSVIVTTAA